MQENIPVRIAGDAAFNVHNGTGQEKFIEWMRDRKHIHELRELYPEIFGKVEGESPLTGPRLLRVYYNTL